MIYAVTKNNKIYKLEISNDNNLETNIQKNLKNILEKKWIDINKRQYDMDYSGDDVFELSLNKNKANNLLKYFTETIEKKEDFKYLSTLKDGDLKAIFFFYENHICIQKDRIIKHLNKNSNKFILSFHNDKFNVPKNMINISIKDYYEGIIKINKDDYSIYFNSPQNIVLHNILDNYHPYKYDDKDSLKKVITEEAYLSKLINIDSTNNIIVDGNTKRKLNRLVQLKEEDINKIISILEAEQYKDKNYIVDNKIFFPKNKKDLKELLKIIFTKIYTWEK